MRKQLVKRKLHVHQVYGINGSLNILFSKKVKILRIDIMIGSAIEKKSWFIRAQKENYLPINKLIKNKFLKKYSGKRTQGIVVLFTGNLIKNLPSFQDSKKNECLLVIDNLEDPQNLGQIIRTAETADITGILLPEYQSVGLTDSVLQVSQGAFIHMPIYSCGNLHTQLRNLKKQNFWIIGIENNIDAISWYKFDYNRKMVIVMGSEGKGIRPVILRTCDSLVTIPMHGVINSLNVASATSVILFERLRQLKVKNND